MGSNQKQKKRSRDLVRLFLHLPRFYQKRLTHKRLDKIKPVRDIYYSTVFAIGSAALGFFSQFIGDKNKAGWLLAVCAIFITLALMMIISIYYLRVIHAISWDHVIEETKHIEKISELDTSKLPSDVLESIKYSSDLMVYVAYLDILIFITLNLSLCLYSCFVIINLLS